MPKENINLKEEKDLYLEVFDQVNQRHLEKENLAARLHELKKSMKAKINNYEIETAAGTPETPEASKVRVKAILGKVGIEKLYEEAEKTDKEKTSAREKFIDKLMEVLADPTKEYRQTGLEDLRKTDPGKCVIKIEKFLGEDGLKLYKAAIEEERESQAFRDAIFLKSIKNYPGAKWTERLILWVAGPSASGKSFFAADAAIVKIGESVMKKNEADQSGNDVVSVDGGIERKVSQMRQLVLQVALKKGYPGIEDLHEHTNLNLKDKIREAALTKGDLSLAMPDTFSMFYYPRVAALAYMLNISPLKKAYLIPEYDGLPNTKQIFAEVIAPRGKEEEFRKAVIRMGESRAWSQNFDLEHTANRIIEINNRDIGCESKKYEAQYFQAGVLGSANAREKYLTESLDKIYVAIPNDLTFMRRDNKGSWVNCEEGYNGPTVMATARDFSVWLAYSKLGYNPNKLPMGLDLDNWVQECRQRKVLSPVEINISSQAGRLALATREAEESPATHGKKTHSEKGTHFFSSSPTSATQQLSDSESASSRRTSTSISEVLNSEDSSSEDSNKKRST